MKKQKNLLPPMLYRLFRFSSRFGLFLLALLNVSILLGQSAKERVFTWNNDAFLQKIAAAPMEKRANAQTQNQGALPTLKVEIPMLDGSTQSFNMVESPVLEDPLKPNWIPIKTYQGHSDDLRTIIRLSVSQFGVTIFLNTPQGVLTLEPVDLSTQKYKISTVENPDFKCLNDEVAALSSQAASAVSCNSYGGTRRDYRFAMAATGEYTTFRTSTANVQADITNLINYLNVLYEVEMALHFNLATGNDNIIYTNGATDPFTPDAAGNASASAAQAGFSTAALLAVMPEANYDIGHVLHYEATGGGWSGQAGPGPCSSGGKARGWSQIRLGATFSIGPFGGVFGHEVGHQLGANHPFFGNAVGCAGNRNPSTAYEPGAATSFMSYNGSCSPQNIGSGSRDLYFHITNLNEMRTLLSGSGSGCSSPTATGNSAPVSNGNPNGLTFNIPSRTPFQLTGSGTDADGNPLTYCWEEYDTDLASSGAAPNAAATTNNQPLFRSFPPTTGSTRIVPQLSDILAGTQTQGEILPQVARSMKFRLTVRDRYTAGGLTLGGWACDEITINVVDIGATGFSLTSQNSATTWTANGTNTANITWNVAGTTAAPISCANVNILFSTDNGQTFPYTLASNVPNNGSASVVIPAYTTYTGRIKIVCASGNIFFDINKSPITITSSCVAEAASVTPTTSVTALAGAAALNLGLTPQYGTAQTSWAASIPTGTPTMPLTFNQNGTGCAAPFSNSPAYTTYTFQVGLQGSYTFTLSSSSSTVMNLYQTSFDNTNTCSNWLASSASGNVTTGTTITATLSPGVNYILVVSGFSTGHAAFTRTVSFTSPAGGSVVTGGPPSPGASFNYAYVVVNTATNNITAIQATSNLTNTTTFPGGSYLVYGLSYQNTTTLTALQSYVGGTLTAFQNAMALLTFCGDLSSNSVSVTITSACTPPTINAPTVTQTTCATATGTIVVNATGGGTLEYSVDNGTTWSTNATFSSLIAGNYNIKVRLQATPTCLSTYASNPVVINAQPATPTAPSVGTPTQPTCAVATGSVVLSGLPATGTWTLTRSPGAVTSTGTGTSTTISGLAAGTYTYTVTNASGCTSVASGNVVINAQPATPTAPSVGTPTQPTCAVPTGSVVLSGLPATGTWTLTRSPGAVTSTGTGTSTTISGLAAGTYTYTVTNSDGCTSVASGNVVINTQPATPTAPSVGTPTQPTCAVATGSVVLSGLPATGTWTLTRSPGAVTSTGTGTSTTISGLAAGTYTYTVTNDVGCTSPSSTNVVINAQPATPTAPSVGTPTQPTCAVATGSVVLSGLPATGTWTLTRSPGAVTTTGTGTSTTISGLAAGTYTYTVTNSDGCTSVASGNVVINTQPATPTAPSVGTPTQPTCAVPTGSVVLSGLPATGTWTLTRSPGAVTTTGTGTSTTISGLAAGTYTYTVTNSDGCTSVASGNVVINIVPGAPAAPTVGTPTQPTCAVATGSVVLSGLPATGTWTLTRSPGAVTSTGTGTSTTISGLAAGTYTYTVTNDVGCTSPSSTNVVINAQPVTPTAPTVGTPTQPTCAVATGSVVLSGLPATGTWTLTRSPGAVTSTGTGTSTTISGLVAGTYTYTVTNADGCTSVASGNVVINVQPATPSAPSVGTPTQPTCAAPTGSVVLSGLPATGTWTLTRSPGAVTTTGTGTSTTISGLAAGTYTYTVTNASGCTSVSSGNVVINTVPGAPAAPTVGATTQPTCAVPTGSVVLSGLPATGTWTLTRSPGAVTTTGTGTSTTVSGVAAGTYTYTVTNDVGCTSPASANIVFTAATGCCSSTIPPTVTLTSPTNGGVAVTDVVLSANAADADGSVSQVNFYWVTGITKTGVISRTLIGSDNTAPYSINWSNVVGGSYNVQAEAVDNCGATTFSTISNVYVLETFTVLITSPTSGQGFVPGSNLTIAASVVSFSSRTVTKVEFYAGTTKLGEDFTAPYTFLWTNVQPGSYALSVRAIDNTGAVWFSPSYYIVGINAGASLQTNSNTRQDDALTMLVSPNPARDAVVLNTHIVQDGEYVFMLTDAIGKLVLTKRTFYNKGENNEALDVSQLPKGLYFVRLLNTEKTQSVVQKLIID